MLPDPRQRAVVRRLWADGPLSRSELHRRLGLTPNAVGAAADALLAAGVLRECPPEPAAVGRPRVPLDIDPASRHVVGLAVAPGRVEAARVGLRGQVLGTPLAAAVDRPDRLPAAAADLLARAATRHTLAVGVSAPGVVDPAARTLVFSSAAPGGGAVDLSPLAARAGDTPLALGNDMYAAGLRWALTHRAGGDDVLLVGLADGEVGGTLLIGGRTNPRGAAAANEVGHTRLAVDTARCYCGHAGCLERVVSSDFLSRSGAAPGARLAETAAAYAGADPPLDRLIELLAVGLGNAVNFARPDRLVLAGRLLRPPAFAAAVARAVRGQLLAGLADRVRVDVWDHPAVGSAETAGWLALAGLYGPDG